MKYISNHPTEPGPDKFNCALWYGVEHVEKQQIMDQRFAAAEFCPRRVTVRLLHYF